MSDAPSTSDLATTVAGLMPQLRADLERLVSIPSVSGPDQDEAAITAAHDAVVELLTDVGVQNVRSLELRGTNPVVLGEVPGPEGAPTVLLYSHYDVVPAGNLDEWHSDPFTPTERDGAIFGRGTADTKGNIVTHLGALRAWGGKPPVGIKVVIEGDEETGGGAFTEYPPTDPDLFAADVLIIADAGSVEPGVPALTVALRGVAEVFVEVRTLGSAKHSGEYGGAAPDALLALTHALATLHDEHGDVAVAGLRREPWTGAISTEAEFRTLTETVPGTPLIGTGDLGSRTISGPAITVVGLDATPVERAVNAVVPVAKAKLNVRVHPEQSAAEAQDAVIAHLEQVKPFGIALNLSRGATGNGFAARTDSPAYDAARAAWSAAWNADVVEVGIGGSIPLVDALGRAVPEADVLLVGCADGHANINGPNERVLLSELEKATLAEADFLGRLAEALR